MTFQVMNESITEATIAETNTYLDSVIGTFLLWATNNKTLLNKGVTIRYIGLLRVQNGDGDEKRFRTDFTLIDRAIVLTTIAAANDQLVSDVASAMDIIVLKLNDMLGDADTDYDTIQDYSVTVNLVVEV